MRWWNREVARQLLALVPTPLCLLVPSGGVVRLLAVWDIYAALYLLLTWLTYRGRGPSELQTMAVASRRRRVTERAFASTPEQISQFAAAVALIATLIVMPQAQRLGVSPGLVLGICIVAVLTAWLMLQSGFAIVYMAVYSEAGGLEFPGDEEPQLVDFLYFAFSVGTTFGTTDVTVTRRGIRRQVLVHGVLAFLFNTLTLAVAVSVATTYLADT